jgi:hypothetical protein
MAVLPGILGCSFDRLRAGTPILFALAALRPVPQEGSQFRGLATAIHEISGLDLDYSMNTGLSSLSRSCTWSIFPMLS